MSVATFIPQVWEASLMRNFYEHSIANLITTAPTKIEGDRIIFNRVSDITIKNYEGKVEYDQLTTSKVDLPMDKDNYFAFCLDDVDAVQAAGDLIGPHTEEASNKLQQETDGIVLKEALSNSAQAVTKEAGENIYDVIVNCNMELNKRRIPRTGRIIVINAEALRDLEVDSRFTEHYKILENGVIEGANINGVPLIFSEELNFNKETKKSKEAVLVLHKSAIGFGSQLKRMEAMRLQGAFSDSVRGLQVCGCKTLRPEALAFYAKAE